MYSLPPRRSNAGRARVDKSVFFVSTTNTLYGYDHIEGFELKILAYNSNTNAIANWPQELAISDHRYGTGEGLPLRREIAVSEALSRDRTCFFVEIRTWNNSGAQSGFESAFNRSSHLLLENEPHSQPFPD